jgi:hypothetical protein
MFINETITKTNVIPYVVGLSQYCGATHRVKPGNWQQMRFPAQSLSVMQDGTTTPKRADLRALTLPP